MQADAVLGKSSECFKVHHAHEWGHVAGLTVAAVVLAGPYGYLQRSDVIKQMCVYAMHEHN